MRYNGDGTQRRERTPALVYWILGFAAGYLLAALVAAPHWRILP